MEASIVLMKLLFSIMFAPVIIVMILLFIGFLSLYSNKNKKNGFNNGELPFEKYKYNKKQSIITPAEKELYQLLYEIYGGQYYIFPQVHLSAIFDHTVYGQNWKGALSHIDRKSVDFVICDKNTMQPLLGIELDDLTHKQEDRHERDMVVEQIFNNAGLPLLRIENHGSFSKEEIQHLALEKLNNKPITN